MRAILLVIGFVLAFAAPAAAQPVFDDPRGLVEHVYAGYLKDEVPGYPTELFTPTLRKLWDDLEAREAASGDVELDFDPFINGQDFQLSDFTVDDPLIEGDTATVVVSFLNYGTAEEMRFTLVRGADGWKIDDLESLSGDFTYRLSELLADDPLLN